jgi:radical SAM protein with 4Fe4S-binding SPASM domain
MESVQLKNGKDVHGAFHHLWLEITQKCNLECQHCYADASPERDLRGSMSDEDWMHVIDEGYRNGGRSIQFIGGEPTLHPSLDRLLEYAKEVGFQQIEVFTNGTSMTNDRAAHFRNLGVCIAVSFYSDRESTHDRITKKTGSFRRTVQGIRNSIAHGVQVRGAIIKVDQSDDEASGGGDLLRQLGVSAVQVDGARHVGRLADLRKTDTDFAELCGSCGVGRLCITASGTIYPCIMARNARLGTVKTDRLSGVLASQPLAEFRERAQLHRACLPASCAPKVGPCHPDSGNCNPASRCGPDAP